MYLVAIAWIYVVLMMTVAEATSSNGTVLGAAITLVFYGLLPVSLVVYLMGAPLRNRRRKALEAQATQAHLDALLATQATQATQSTQTASSPSIGLGTDPAVNAPDAGREAPAAAAVAPVRKES